MQFSLTKILNIYIKDIYSERNLIRRKDITMSLTVGARGKSVFAGLFKQGNNSNVNGNQHLPKKYQNSINTASYLACGNQSSSLANRLASGNVTA